MSNNTFLKKILSTSPHIEMMVRRLYWKNINILTNRRKKKHKKNNQLNLNSFNLSALKNHLIQTGVSSGSLIVVHSAFASFKGRVSDPNDLLDLLFNVVGPTGTVAMPAMPLFRNAKPIEDYLSKNKDEETYIYDVRKSKIKTGLLPTCLHKHNNSVRSRHPINSMVAVGSLSSELMKDNLIGESPLACGLNSSWNRCVEHDAIIIGLGTDLTHSLTMIHVAEDVKDHDWPVDNWYIEKKFLIKDENFEELRVLRERAPHWGALHFGERTLCKDLINAGLLKSTYIDGILVEILSAKALINFLNQRNSKGYPYFWLKS